MGKKLEETKSLSAKENDLTKSSPGQNKGKIVLVIDDDDTFSSVLKKVLTSAGYEAVLCSEAQGALHIFSVGHYDVVISDIRLDHGKSGIDLMYELKNIRPVPVILMTGFADIIETQEAIIKGADGFLAKPFNKADIIQILNTLFPNPEENKEPPNLDENFCKLGIDDFISGKEVRYDVYVRLMNGKRYIKIAHQGENLATDRIQAYKEKKIIHLYLKKEDYRNYIGINLMLTPKVVSNQKLDNDKKLGFLKHVGEIILEKFFFDGVDEIGFDQSKVLVENTLHILKDCNQTVNMLDALNSHSDYLYAHSLGVSIYSTMLAREMGWISPTTLSKVAIGGLFHDIGKKEIDRAILEKPRIALTSEEVALFESHPIRGLEILRQVPGISEEILQIVCQHHENHQGWGYPYRLNKHKINPMASLISVANEFCNYVIKNPNSLELTPKEAIKQILLVQERFDKTVVQALMRLFKVSSAKLLTKSS